KESRVTYAPTPSSLSNAFPMAISLDQQQNKTTAPSANQPEGAEEIKSPMVGTFYRSAGPGKSAFVEKGADVKKGDILCIVEAMKIMNDINSTMDGKLLDILVENGETVEYGQPLFVIQKK
ncbi:MAG: acetyl-CoA carboxylase biotin carboxyl carrier protein, partial [Planctomycetota bacterium]